MVLADINKKLWFCKYLQYFTLKYKTNPLKNKVGNWLICRIYKLIIEITLFVIKR